MTTIGGLFWQLADGAGSAERLTTADEGDAHVPDSVSSDGEWLSFTVDTGTESAVWVLALASGEAEPLIVEPAARVGQSVFSPDGRWLAYQSTETGEDEIFVQPFPPTGAKYQLPNVLDNHHPLWSPDGRELFYVPGPGEFTVVGVTTQPSFSFGNPVSLNLFQSELRTGPPNQRRRHDIMPDGSGFLGVGRGDVANVNRIHIVQNWFEELRRLVPTD